MLTRGKPDTVARDEILEAYEAAQGKTIVAAQRLGVHKVTLLRAVRRLGLSDEIARRWPDPAREAYAQGT